MNANYRYHELLSALHAERGIVCLTGAGGKKTAIYLLANLHPGRVAITSTVHMQAFRRRELDHMILEEDTNLSRAVATSTGRVTGYANPGDDAFRLGGVDPQLIPAIHTACGHDLTLIKADGARGRHIKAPAEYEPVLPAKLDTLIPIVGARVIGRPLDAATAHRPERIAQICKLPMGSPIESHHVAILISQTYGNLPLRDSTIIVPLINMVDDPGLARAAREAASQLLEYCPRIHRVVLACLRRSELVEVVVR